jgi:integrase/recombinase XerD
MVYPAFLVSGESMANRKVSVWKYVKVGSRWKYSKPVMGRNHKPKPHWAMVNGKPEYHPEGNFYISYREGRKKIWKKIGPNPSDAVHAAYVEKSILNAKSLGVQIKPEVPKLDYDAQMWKFLNDYKLSQSLESHALMRQTLEEFRKVCKKAILSDITREDFLRYKQWLIARGRSLRTAGNKMLRANQFYRSAMGLGPGEGLVTVKDGKFVEKEPEVYTDDELDAFFKACSSFYSLVFHTLLMAGLRKQEMENLEWPDINFEVATVSVRGKKNFQPKDWEERDIEIPRELLEMLFSARKDRGLVFATKTGKKYTHVWDDCKDIAKKVGAVLAQTVDKDETDRIIEENAAKYHPHKFRATYCTKLLQSGIDLKTVQKLMGHKTIESTMRYLAKAESHKVKAKVDAVQWKKRPPAEIKTGSHTLPLETKLVWSEE